MNNGKSYTEVQMPNKCSTETSSRIFAKPPIMLGEDLADYEAMRDLVLADIDQDDVQECFLARDILDSEWELLRLRGMKPGMLHAAITRAVNTMVREESALQPLEPEWHRPLRRHLIGALVGVARDRQQLEELLSEHDLTLELVIGAAFESTLRPQVDTDRMIGAALDRRRAAYRELNEYRERKEARARCETESRQVPAANHAERNMPTVASNLSAGNGHAGEA
jgi:hypothetical protein